MKKLNKILGSIIIVTTIILTSSSYAYTGEVDPEEEIAISEVIADGTGYIDIKENVNGYRLYYQWIELDNNTYNEIRMLKNELQVIEYHNIYEVTEKKEYKDYYTSSQEYYKSLYGNYLEDLSNERVMENFNKIEELLPDHTDSWTRTMDNTFEIDLGKFSGEKKYVVWVQLEKEDGNKAYEAEIFELTGTKQESTNNKPNDDKPDNNKPNDDKTNEDKPNDNKPNDDKTDEDKPNNNQPEDKDSDKNDLDKKEPEEEKNDKKQEDKKSTEKNKQEKSVENDKTVSSKILPNTGIKDIAMIVGIFTFSIMAIIFHKKYKKLK